MRLGAGDVAPRVEHPLHERRRGRNVGLGLVLAAFVVLVFALSVVKVEQGDMMEAFDHQQRNSVLPIAPVAPEPGPAPAAPEASPAPVAADPTPALVSPSTEKPVP